MIRLWPIRHSVRRRAIRHEKKKREKHEAGNAETILKETSNFSLLTQSSGREDRLCPPRDIREKLAKGRGGERGAKGGKRNVKILPSFCHASRTGLVNCCQIKKTGREKKKNSRGRLI